MLSKKFLNTFEAIMLSSIIVGCAGMPVNLSALSGTLSGGAFGKGGYGFGSISATATSYPPIYLYPAYAPYPPATPYPGAYYAYPPPWASRCWLVPPSYSVYQCY